MPKRGQTQPWKVRYQYPDKPQYTIAKGGLPAAVSEMLQLSRRGAEVSLAFKDETGLHQFSVEQMLSGLREYKAIYGYLVDELVGWQQGQGVPASE